MTTSTAKSCQQALLASRWLEEHGDYLFRYARTRVFDHSHCEDIVQETLITAIDKHSTF
jgi:RNA polymerase sigma-70 factor, ECF subfamily